MARCGPVGSDAARPLARRDEDHSKEIESFFAGNLEEPQEVLVAEEQGTLVAFAELSMRMALPVATGRRVGYVEGLYLLPTFRNSGLARQLLRAARGWAQEENCCEFCQRPGGAHHCRPTL